MPAREGVLIFDGTSFSKGTQSAGVARHYCGALGKIANCQVATTAALWTGTQAWLLGAQLYLPVAWLSPEARQRAQIPAATRFHEKWRHALTLFRQIRIADFRITAVLADAEFGDNTTLRTAWHRAGIAYAVGPPSTFRVRRPTRPHRGAAMHETSRPAPYAPHAARRPPPPIGRHARRRVARARVAHDHLAQCAHGARGDGAVCRAARHVGARLAPPPRTGGVAPRSPSE